MICHDAVMTLSHDHAYDTITLMSACIHLSVCTLSLRLSRLSLSRVLIPTNIMYTSYACTHMQEDLRKNYCLKSIGQEIERAHTSFLHLYRPHTTTESTHLSKTLDNHGKNCSIRSIGQELERICRAIEDIEDAHLKEEKKRMDYSFYGSSPSPSVVSSSREGPGDEAAASTPSVATEDEDESRINEELFEEYFASYLTHGTIVGTSTKSHSSLHVPSYSAGRRHSQTLV